MSNPSNKADSYPPIPGVRVADVIERLNLSWDELQGRLLQFAADHGGALKEMRAALNSGDMEEARQLAVVIGIAAVNFGADGLWEKSRLLEHALRTGNKAYEYLFDDMEMEFDGLVKAIEALRDPSANPEVRDVLQSLYDYGALRRAFDELQSRLRAAEWEAVDAALDRIVEQGIPPVALEGFREMKKLIEDRDAQSALEMAGLLKQNLE